MIKKEIIESLLKLSVAERLMILDEIVHSIRKEFEENTSTSDKSDIKAQLLRASETLLKDYTEDRELTAFSSLDGEDFLA